MYPAIRRYRVKQDIVDIVAGARNAIEESTTGFLSQPPEPLHFARKPPDLRAYASLYKGRST